MPARSVPALAVIWVASSHPPRWCLHAARLSHGAERFWELYLKAGGVAHDARAVPQVVESFHGKLAKQHTYRSAVPT